MNRKERIESKIEDAYFDLHFRKLPKLNRKRKELQDKLSSLKKQLNEGKPLRFYNKSSKFHDQKHYNWRYKSRQYYWANAEKERKRKKLYYLYKKAVVKRN